MRRGPTARWGQLRTRLCTKPSPPAARRSLLAVPPPSCRAAARPQPPSRLDYTPSFWEGTSPATFTIAPPQEPRLASARRAFATGLSIPTAPAAEVRLQTPQGGNKGDHRCDHSHQVQPNSPPSSSLTDPASLPGRRAVRARLPKPRPLPGSSDSEHGPRVGLSWTKRLWPRQHEAPEQPLTARPRLPP